ncbi:hypothetical protein EG329_003785 [Mollisiaceae sp. DMI_Dod_QoI]|nr:hypothetical protein EG329_003785 [Helotiales sp. DMI_Dod_QoI]
MGWAQVISADLVLWILFPTSSALTVRFPVLLWKKDFLKSVFGLASETKLYITSFDTMADQSTNQNSIASLAPLPAAELSVLRAILLSRTTWLKETPRSAQPSRITAVKEQQCGECGWNVTSVGVGRVALDNRSRLQQSGDMSVSVACGAEGTGEGNGPSVLETAATVEPDQVGSLTWDSAYEAWNVVYVGE